MTCDPSLFCVVCGAGLFGRIVGDRDACLAQQDQELLRAQPGELGRPERGSGGASRRDVAPACDGSRAPGGIHRKAQSERGETPVLRDQCETPVLRVLEKLAGTLPEVADDEDIKRGHDSLQLCSRSVAQCGKDVRRVGAMASRMPSAAALQATDSRTTSRASAAAHAITVPASSLRSCGSAPTSRSCASRMKASTGRDMLLLPEEWRSCQTIAPD